jgi:hypothetical protein
VESMVNSNKNNLKRCMDDMDTRLSKRVKNMVSSVETLQAQLCPDTAMLDNPVYITIKHLLGFMLAVGPATSNLNGITPCFDFFNYPGRTVSKANTCVVISKGMLKFLTCFPDHFHPRVPNGFQTKFDKVVYSALGSISAGISTSYKHRLEKRFPSKEYKQNGIILCLASTLANLIRIMYKKELDGTGIIVSGENFNITSTVNANGKIKISDCAGTPTKKCSALARKMREFTVSELDEDVYDADSENPEATPEELWEEQSMRMQWNKSASPARLSDPSFRHGVDIFREAMGKDSGYTDNDTPVHVGAYFEMENDIPVPKEDYLTERREYLETLKLLRSDVRIDQ